MNGENNLYLDVALPENIAIFSSCAHNEIVGNSLK